MVIAILLESETKLADEAVERILDQSSYSTPNSLFHPLCLNYRWISRCFNYTEFFRFTKTQTLPSSSNSYLALKLRKDREVHQSLSLDLFSFEICIYNHLYQDFTITLAKREEKKIIFMMSKERNDKRLQRYQKGTWPFLFV
ncbi:hypothetical protein POM88_048025 [Heracleum sosnowskyi]|uniref:Uncharacterized protein n=1 Tax=Heracleum sosnowskyi TaxID=360622 RepID=A0AAD8M042_9APIA|nr:hypothetical protein POM88_048025 [Heracleum sosnowskyi]